MRIEHGVSLAIGRLFGRLMRRAAAMAFIGVFVLGVIYQLSAAGTLALERLYGALYAHLIVGGIDAAIVLAIAAVLYATRARPLPNGRRPAGVAGAPMDVRIAMLLESVLLGYELARTKKR